jgi:hypothetical protein
LRLRFVTNVPVMDWRGSRGGGLVALGFFLARRGAMAAVGVALTAASVVGFGGLAAAFASHGKLDALPSVPLVASSVLAFGVGVLVAFAASTRAFRRDEDEGVRALLRLHGVDAAHYLAARVVGLALSLAAFVAGGSALIGLVAIVVARGRVPAAHTIQASVASVVFGVAFAVTFAPVAMATLGARSRGGGYLALLAVLVVPELLEPSLARYIPPSWLEVCSVPGALLALRTALAPVGVDAVMLSHALVALLIIIAVALVVVRGQLAREHGTADASWARHLP